MLSYLQEGGGAMEDRQALACFDFDGTMIRGDSIVSYLKTARRRGLLSRRGMASVLWHTICFFLGLENSDETKTRALRFRKKLTAEAQESLDREFALQELLPRIYPGALTQWKTHQAEGKKMLLVSASTDNYMHWIADALGADALLCTRLTPDGRVTGNCKGEEKVRRIRAWLRQEGIGADWEASFAYGDGKSDLPMLRLAGHPVQVNPKRKLKKAAPEMARADWTV